MNALDSSNHEPAENFFAAQSIWSGSLGTLAIARGVFPASNGLNKTLQSPLNQSIDDLQPEFRLVLVQTIKQLEQQGHAFQVLETLRSPERQNELFEQGRNPEKPGAKVTNARANESAHQFGLATDLAPVINGEISLDVSQPETLEAFQALGKAAQAQGLVWGGQWKMLDWGHVEMRPVFAGTR